MRSMAFLVLALALVVSGGLLSCTKAAPPAAPLKPPTIALSGVFVAAPGAAVPDGTVTALLKALTKWGGIPEDKAKEAETVSTIQANAVGMALETAFTVKNPNAYLITVNSIDFAVKVNSSQVGSIVPDQTMVIKGISDDLYVPANGQISVSGNQYVGFASLLGERALQKGLGGAAAAADGLKVWEAVKKGELTYSVTGTMQVVSQGGNAAVPFSFTYKP